MNPIVHKQHVLAEVFKCCQIPITSHSVTRSVMNQRQVSAQTYHCMLNLSSTIADLAGVSQIASQHLTKVLNYLPKLTTR
jgi:predicted ATPase with chaperone activity